jgi:hypothetical protein
MITRVAPIKTSSLWNLKATPQAGAGLRFSVS